MLLLKWADRMHSEGIDGVLRNFQHPFIQTGCLFFGQFLCFLMYEITFKLLRRRQDGSEERNILTIGNEDYSPRVFMVATICEVIASILLFTGLYLTTASSYMMLQCAVIIFVGIFSVTYLNQTLSCYQWIGILVLASGAGFITVNDYYLYKSNSVLTGDLLVLCSLVFHGIKYIQEEKYIKVLDIPPLRAIGWQGVFGLFILTVLYVPLNFLKAGPPFGNNAHGVVEDFLDAIAQMANNFLIVLAHCLFIASVAIHNYCGARITKDISSAARVRYNTLIAILVWSFACFFEWEMWDAWKFVILLLILCGGWIYRNCYFVPMYRQVLRVYARRRNGDNQADQITNQPADVI